MTVVAASDIVGQVGNTTQSTPAPKTSTFVRFDTEKAINLYGENRKEVPPVFDNKTGELDLQRVEVLKTTRHSKSYHWMLADFLAGWIFYEGGKFYENIQNAGVHKATYCADTIEELILGVNRIYEK